MVNNSMMRLINLGRIAVAFFISFCYNQLGVGIREARNHTLIGKNNRTALSSKNIYAERNGKSALENHSQVFGSAASGNGR